MKRMRKCNDEVYQLAKDQALVKKLKNKTFRPFCLYLPGDKYKISSVFKVETDINISIAMSLVGLLDMLYIFTIQVGKKIKDRKERVFGSASYKHYTRKV
jgi:hypothetical protein